MGNLEEKSLEELTKQLEEEKVKNQKAEIINQIKKEQNKRTFVGKLGQAGKEILNKVGKIGVNPAEQKASKGKKKQKKKGVLDILSEID